MRTWLLDTGPIVAYLDGMDSEHGRVAQSLDGFGGRLVTSSAVITETMHFMASQKEGPATLLEFLTAARVQITECTEPNQLSDAVKLMRKYADVPMDFADATLVLLAESLGVDHVCTLDRRGFTVYRFSRNKRFILVLDQS